MYYIYNNEDRTKTVTLQFLRDELLYDVEQYTYVEGDVQRADAEHLKHGKHQTQDAVQEGNVDMVTRHLDLALARCREALYPYVKTEVADETTMNDVLTSTPMYEITMLVPEDFSVSTVQLLEQLIHNLLVYYALWGWLSITKPEGAGKWLEQAQDMEEELKGALARRCGKTYRRMSPFDSGTGRR